jgi:hypothetical protein
MFEKFGTPLTRGEMKQINGGRAPSCSIEANCYKTTYNNTTRQWETKQTGTAKCDNSSDGSSCTTTATGVDCGTGGSGTCGAGSTTDPS